MSDSLFCLERSLGTRVFGAKLEENRDSYLASQHKAHCVVIRGDWRGDSIQVLFVCEFYGMMWKCVREGFAYHRARNRALRCTIRRFKLTERSEHSFHGICAFWFLHCLEILCLVHSTVVAYASHGHGSNYCFKFHGMHCVARVGGL